MTVHKLTVTGFRNLSPTVFEPSGGVNIVYGDNAQGKTNLLEGLWLFTGGRSFRGAKDAECVGFGQEKAALSLEFEAFGRRQDATITVEKRRSVTLNGIARPSSAALAGVLCGVVFSPVHLSLIKDGPDGRRRFLDAACCQVRPAYIKTVATYSRIVTQRNALLKDFYRLPDARDLLAAWDERLVQYGAEVCAARAAYLKRLGGPAFGVYDGLSGGREKLALRLTHGLGGQEELSDCTDPAVYAVRLRQALAEAAPHDIAAGITTVGPHRGDLEVDIGGRAARQYASQGQQRSAVLALKLAEASVLGSETGEHPIALLDDVMSELDESRQEYILNHIRDWQVFITCCDPANIRQLAGGTVFRMAGGVLTKESE